MRPDPQKQDTGGMALRCSHSGRLRAGLRGESRASKCTEQNCADALAAGNNADMRLMMGRTMHEVRVALEAYAEDPDADLPSCDDARSSA